jgi:hypothetical protein
MCAPCANPMIAIKETAAGSRLGNYDSNQHGLPVCKHPEPEIPDLGHCKHVEQMG